MRQEGSRPSLQTEWQTSGFIVGVLNGKTLKVPVIQQISCLGVVMLETSQHPGTVDQSFWHSTIWMARTDSDQLMCCPCWRSLFMSHASDMLIGQYSSIDRLKKAFCWLLCVRRKLLDKAGAALCGLITLTEMRNGGTLLIDYAQKSLFERELAALQSAKCVSRSCRICSLSPKMVNVLLVVGGMVPRLKCPVILSHQHPLSHKIIAELHNSAVREVISRSSRICSMSPKMAHGSTMERVLMQYHQG